LPDGDGWELSRRAKFARPVFAIAISGYGAAADRARSIAAGYRYHIVKPLDIELLDRLLEEVTRECSA
jgi:CheY-like chemotaxis protein